MGWESAGDRWHRADGAFFVCWHSPQAAKNVHEMSSIKFHYVPELLRPMAVARKGGQACWSAQFSKCLINYHPFNQTSQSHSKEGGDIWLVDDGDNFPNQKKRTDNGRFDIGQIKLSRTERSGG